MRFIRSLWCLAALSLSACSLITDFDPEGQPCDTQGRCLEGYVCRNKMCVESPGSGTDGGVDVVSQGRSPHTTSSRSADEATGTSTVDTAASCMGDSLIASRAPIYLAWNFSELHGWVTACPRPLVTLSGEF